MVKKKVEKENPFEIKESAHRIWLAGLGALASAEEEGGKLFKSLVSKGKKVEARGKVQLDKVKGQVKKARTKAESTFDKFGGAIDDKVAAAVKRLGVPTRTEVQKLTRRVEALNKKVDQLKPKASATRTRKTA